MSYNLPDNTSAMDKDAPWNEEDVPACPECGAPLIIHSNDKHCIDIKCSECDYSIYSDDFDV